MLQVIHFCRNLTEANAAQLKDYQVRLVNWNCTNNQQHTITNAF